MAATGMEQAAALIDAVQEGDLALLQARLAAADADVNAQDEDGDTALHAACGNGHVDIVRWLVEAGARLDIKNKEGESVLYDAISSGDVAVVDLLMAAGYQTKKEEEVENLQAALETESTEMLLCLVKYGADLSVKARDGGSVLHLAASVNNADAIAFLVKDAGLDVNARNARHRTPLHEAGGEGHVEAARGLLQNRADVDARDDEEETALMKAIDGGHRKLVELLLDAGADVNAAQEDGWMPIHCAANCGDVKTVKLLLGRGADVHSLTKDGRSVLGCAASFPSEEAITFIAQQCPNDINKADELGWAPVHYAAARGTANTLKLLIELGAAIDTVTKTGGSPLMIAARSGRLDTAALLVEYGQDVHAFDEEHGWSVLHAAAQSGCVEVIELLVRLGADLNAKDKNGVSVLHTATSAGHNAATMALLRAGANAKVIDESNGWTTLFYAAAGGNVELLKLLIESGEDAHAVANDGKTALHVACSKGKRDAVAFIVTLGVDVNAVDENGRTALHYASQAEDSGCVASLIGSEREVFVNEPDKDGYLPVHLSAMEIVLEETAQLLKAGADVHALTNSGESALHLAVFASDYCDTPLLAEAGAETARVLCSFGSTWTPQCDAKLEAMKAEAEVSDVETREEKRQQLQWCMGMRACVLHWEKQHKEGARELLNVPSEVIQNGDASVMAYIEGASR